MLRSRNLIGFVIRVILSNPRPPEREPYTLTKTVSYKNRTHDLRTESLTNTLITTPRSQSPMEIVVNHDLQNENQTLTATP